MIVWKLKIYQSWTLTYLLKNFFISLYISHPQSPTFPSLPNSETNKGVQLAQSISKDQNQTIEISSFLRNQISPPNLRQERIEFETLGAAHSKVSSQHHHIDPN